MPDKTYEAVVQMRGKKKRRMRAKAHSKQQAERIMVQKYRELEKLGK